MTEDYSKLTREEIIRLECIRHAQVTSHGWTSEAVVRKAQVFEDYVRTGDTAK